MEEKLLWKKNEEKPKCPECGDWLSSDRFIDKSTGEITIEFWCEGPGSDEFDFIISTGLQDRDLKKLKQIGKIIKKEMQIKLLARKKEQE
jgi:hypothetical protein